jgi:hypothetical protein
MYQGELLAFARSILAEFEPIYADLLSNSDLLGWLAGYDEVAQHFPPWLQEQFSRGARPPGKPPRIVVPGLFGETDGDEPQLRFPQLEKAIQSLVDRRILTREQFDAIADDAKYRAFTVARIDSEDTIGKIRDALTEDIQEGASLEGFRQRVEDVLDVSPIGPAHLENVYRTNIQAAFRDGRESLASHPIVEAVFPYQEYLPIHDGRCRPDHLALGSLGLNGTGVYRRDDPMWDFFTPPWAYNDRCGTNLLSVEKAASKGVREAQEWLRTGNPPLNPEHCLGKISFRPLPGWGGRGVRIGAAA